MSTRIQTNQVLRNEKGAQHTLDTYDVVEEFGIYVFDDKTMRQKLPKMAYKQFKAAKTNGTKISADLADQIATTMKEWALGLGATHYTHQFQPMTGRTAEKHDSFLEPLGGGNVIMEFNGKILTMGEPDASSFPSGGIRETHEARGYTAWDHNTPVFVRTGVNGATLVIPTAFVSWTGEALDYKTPLLRASDHVSTIATKFLHTLGHTDVTRVVSTLGCEQEYFLVDRGYFISRPDLQSCGRTLIGNVPPRGQQLDDHYFGTIPPRVLAYMQECEQALWRLGMPVKTRHNEVAPGQFETAPVFEEASIASDHNLLQMAVMQEIAQKHGLEFLMHEKPFAGVNGSGKHHNYSLATDTGINMLEPTNDPMNNKVFMATLTACIRAVDVHADVLRASIANPGNDFRLGANEAPPAIMSVFLGSDLDAVVRATIDGKALTDDLDRTLTTGARSLPDLTRDTTDRNRTSPFAFTGNKFEFRAVGSAMNCAIPSTSLNMIVADSLAYLDAEITRLVQGGGTLESAFNEVIRATLKQHYRVVFNGNGYSPEWVKEAEARGLPNFRTVPDAVAQWCTEKNLQLFSPILSKREMEARHNVWLEQYAQQQDIEAATLINLVDTKVLPAAFAYQQVLAKSVLDLKSALGSTSPAQTEELKTLSSHIDDLIAANRDLRKKNESAPHGDLQGAANYMRDQVATQIGAVRTHCDWLEAHISAELWPLPTYNEMLLLK